MTQLLQDRFTSAELCAITGLPSLTLAQWVGRGLLTPVRVGGRGRGFPHLFSQTQVLAVMAGLRWREAGAGADWVAGVVKCLGSLDATTLESAIADGRTYTVPAARLGGEWVPGELIEPTGEAGMLPPGLDLADIQRCMLGRLAQHAPCSR
ncbi:MerR family transcriptional regulator [Urbifossiella limnaea]|uniref:MerR family transcriptional regulator n=1 Tax=Urbifossiella limnaea TaxID=2528023 RepID=UPI0036F22860